MKADSSAPWTILKLLQWATTYFQTKEVSEPRASAEVLLAHSLETSRLNLYLQYDRPLTPEELTRFKTFIKRRLQREPTQYITGHQEFWSLDFLVSHGVLIPRPETEILVETVLQQVKLQPILAKGLRLLDMGTGSGILAVTLAKELSGCRVLALDLSIEALQLARENSRRHQVGQFIDFVQGNLWQPLQLKPVFQVIVSNPPYISRQDLADLPLEVKKYEPHAALDGGHDGLDIVRGIISEAFRYLTPGGLLALEIGYGQAGEVLKFLGSFKNYETWTSVKDYQGIERVVLARTAA